MSNRENKSEKRSDFRKVPISDYPDHVESFETYYYLGEGRTLKETAFIRFQQLVPNCPPDVPEFRPKFDSFYRKIKRWAEKESWNEWVKRKEIEERLKREKEAAAILARSVKYRKNNIKLE